MQAGLGVAVQYANQLGADWIWERVQQLAAELRAKLSSIPGVTVHDRGRRLCGIVSFTKVGPLTVPHTPDCTASEQRCRLNLGQRCFQTVQAACKHEKCSDGSVVKNATIV